MVKEIMSRLRKAALRVETNPSEGQKHAGNYTKGHIKWRGLDITIENPKGSVRSGKTKEGRAWSSILPDHYGYIKRTSGADGDHVDCYFGPDHRANRVYVIDQKHHETEKFDEHKCMLSYDSIESAKRAYRAAFSDDKDRILHVTAMTLSRFKGWLKGDTTKPLRYFSGQ